MADDLRRHPGRTVPVPGAHRGADAPAAGPAGEAAEVATAVGPEGHGSATGAEGVGCWVSGEGRSAAGLGAALDSLGAVDAAAALDALMGQEDLDDVADPVLVDLVALAVRLRGWAYAAGARLAGALADRAAMNPAWSALAGVPAETSVAGDELAMRLAWSRRAATRLVRHGRAFAGALWPTGDALAAGQVDEACARVVADRLEDVPGEVALAVQERVLPGALRRTPTQVRRDVERALIEVDPVEARRRHATAVRTRRVERPRVLPDGMAGIWAVLTAADAARVDSTLDSAARTARAAGDPRSLDQLRADGLRDLVAGTPAPLPRPAAEDPDDAVASDAGPADARSAGAGSIGACSAGAGSTDARTAGADSTDACSAGAGSIDACSAGAGSIDACSAGAGSIDANSSGACSSGAGCAAHTGRPTPPRSTVRVTVALSTLLGLDDRPGDLHGYGPVTAEAARALAEGGVWQRLVTDPLSGTVLDVGRTRYRPPEGLVAHVQARDGTCARPGCPADAGSCDLDHTVEFRGPRARPGGHGAPSAAGDVEDPAPSGAGVTAAHNLEPLCRRDHRLKTDGGFTLHQVRPGEYVWITPTGHRYRVVPGADGHHEHLGGPAGTGGPAETGGSVDPGGLGGTRGPVGTGGLAGTRGPVGTGGLAGTAGLPGTGVRRTRRRAPAAGASPASAAVRRAGGPLDVPTRGSGPPRERLGFPPTGPHAADGHAPPPF